MSELGWQEWYRANIKDKGLNPLTAAKTAWIYRGQRIAELEAELANWKSWALCRNGRPPEELPAENQRLREGIQNILLHTLRGVNYTYDVRLANDLLDGIERKARALLGGGNE